MMTQTLKIKRPVVTEHYRGIIEGMFEKSWSVWDKKRPTIQF
jgi:hypothetical protein